MSSVDSEKIKVLDREYEIKNGRLIWDGACAEPRSESVPFSPNYVRNVTMCVHISPDCNLACKYCFKNVRGNIEFDDVRRFADIVTALYPRADRYIVDMSGAGEPLLRKDLVLRIADYCKTLSDKFMREFLPTFVTNGTLLNEQTVNELQDAGIIFGVSLDGTKELHDKNRVFANGKGSYDIVEKNVRNIERKTFLGAAVTYSEPNLLDSFLNAFSLVPTVSMKPVRYDGDPIDAEAICDSYDKLVSYVLDATLRGNFDYVFSLINGDDYFGKFLKRVASAKSVYGRCDAGIARFALAGDKKIYCCPAGAGNPLCEVGDLEVGIRRRKLEDLWRLQLNSGCDGCFARSACGGECKIVSYNKYGRLDGIDGNMCVIKRRLYALSVYFCERLRNEKPDGFVRLCDEIGKIDGYSALDEELTRAAEASVGKYTFTELKELRNNKEQKFRKILNEIFNKHY